MLTILAFLFVLGVLIFVHELGHFLMARLHGVRVLRFSLGFDPKLVSVVRGGTEYSIGIVPLGGFVKMAGDSVDDQRSGAPDEFLSQSKWVRFQVYLAGPTMNILLAWVLLTVTLSHGADVPRYRSAPAVIGTVAADSPAAKAGLEPGDRIVRVGTHDVATWDDLDLAVEPNPDRKLEVVVMRGQQRIDAEITPEAVTKYEIGDLGISPVLRPEIMAVDAGGPADLAGIKAGDVVVAAAGKAVDQTALMSVIQKSAGTPLTLTIERQGATRDVSVTPAAAGGNGMIHVTLSAYEVRHEDLTLWQAAGMSAQRNWQTTVLIWQTLTGLVTGQTPMRRLMGPVAIAQLSGTYAALGWTAFLDFMAMISINLGLINLLPIPVMDGGHIAILGFEGLSRRDLSVKVKERILMAGAALIVLLMVTVIYNDVMRLLR